jgi:uncharacterized membrane protein
MNLLRFVMLLSLVVWIGGIIFFAFVVAPGVFAVLPTHDLAGKVVSRSLTALHWMGIASGVAFLVTSMIYSRLAVGYPQPFSARNALIMLMLILTLISVYVVGAKMLVLRNDMGVIDNVPQNDPRRVEFNALHKWSTRLEGTVLLLGLATLYLTGRAIGT